MKNDSSLNYVKNKFRGIVAVYRSKKFNKDKKLTDSAVFRQEIKCLYLECRHLFSENRYQSVVSWITKSIQAQLPELSYQEVGFEDLRFIKPEFKPLSLNSEISWVVSRLLFFSKEVSVFLSFKKQIESLVLSGEYFEALKAIDLKEKKIGATLWSVKLKISLLQTVKGLESQKQYTAGVRSIWVGGILSYIALFTSVRNEERTSIGKYSDEMEIKFNNQKLDKNLVPHLRYHLLAELPSSEEDAVNLLVMEQVGTVYDLYETFVDTIFHSLKPNGLKLKREFVLDIVRKLYLINDPRLPKVDFIISGGCSSTILQIRSHNLSDKVISNDKKALLKTAKIFRSSKHDFKDVWDYIYFGIWLSLQEKNHKLKNIKPHKIPFLLGHAMSEGNMVNDINTIIKLSVNYYGISVFAGIKEFLALLIRNSKQHHDLWSPHFIGLRSDYLGIEDVPLDSSDHKCHLSFASLTAKLWVGDVDEIKSKVDKYTLSILENLRLLASKKIDESLLKLPAEISKDIPLPYRLIFSQMKLYSFSKERMRPEIIKLVNETVPSSDDILDIVAFEKELIEFEFEDYDSTDEILNAPIALFVAWLKTENSRLLSYLRISTKKAIKKYNVTKPSEIKEVYNKDVRKLVFFLSNICVPQVIDCLRDLKGTKIVLNERQDICRQLACLDFVNKKDYDGEIEAIADDLLMEEGKRVVDRTRIYVDMDAHTRWKLKELKEDYERYKDLLEIKVSGDQNYDEIVEDFLSAEGPTKTTFVPDNEADAVLLSIVAKASNDFLTNPKYGLDYFLSKRIRHQSFIGLIRSHLEFSNLITTRVSEGDDFDYNHMWIGKFNTLSQVDKDKLNEMMSNFAEEFDDSLIHVRDNVFQLNTESCPNGLIKIDFNIKIMSLLKHFIIETNSSFEEFVYYTNIFMWAFLQPSLEKTRNYIQKILKQQIMQDADKLKANARKLASHDPAFEDFELQLTDKIAAVQRSLEDVMSWFTPLIGVSADRVVLSVDKALNLSTNAALDMLKPFNPKLSVEIKNPDDVKLQQQGLTFINDTIFILFDNIKSHSGLKNPDVKLTVVVNSEKEVITIRCCNNTRLNDRERLKGEIEKIKYLIENGKAGDRAKVEGRSGFIKLAASIDKTNKGCLDFNLLEDGDFYLSISNDLKVKQVPVEDLRVENV